MGPQNVDEIRIEASLIFLGISCLAMRMTLRNLWTELWPRMRLRIHHFDLESKKQSMQWKHSGSPPPKIFKRVSSAGKVMASIFWDNWGVIMVNYLEEGRTINGAYYAEELRWLCQEIVRKRRGKLTWGILLLQDNAPAHTSQVAIAAVTECGFKVLPHPPYSPDLAPSEFYLFPNLKTNIHGRNFRSNEGVIDAVNEYLGTSMKTSILKG